MKKKLNFKIKKKKKLTVFEKKKIKQEHLEIKKKDINSTTWILKFNKEHFSCFVSDYLLISSWIQRKAMECLYYKLKN